LANRRSFRARCFSADRFRLVRTGGSATGTVASECVLAGRVLVTSDVAGALTVTALLISFEGVAFAAMAAASFSLLANRRAFRARCFSSERFLPDFGNVLPSLQGFCEVEVTAIASEASSTALPEGEALAAKDAASFCFFANLRAFRALCFSSERFLLDFGAVVTLELEFCDVDEVGVDGEETTSDC